jgi:hypothetical protein
MLTHAVRHHLRYLPEEGLHRRHDGMQGHPDLQSGHQVVDESLGNQVHLVGEYLYQDHDEATRLRYGYPFYSVVIEITNE